MQICKYAKEDSMANISQQICAKADIMTVREIVNRKLRLKTCNWRAATGELQREKSIKDNKWKKNQI